MEKNGRQKVNLEIKSVNELTESDGEANLDAKNSEILFCTIYEDHSASQLKRSMKQLAL